MIDFEIKQPEVKGPQEIENLSMETITSEAKDYPRFQEFTPDQQKVAQRMIHTTTCFDQIINNIYFSKNATEKIKQLLSDGASIITDTNMIRAGLSKVYTEKYDNKVICYVAEPEVKYISEEEGVTRTVAAVKKALSEQKKASPVILACGNAPTFLYAAIEYLVKNECDLSNIAILGMPVGFVNVVESKEYALDFMNKTGVEGIIMQGRYGGSPLIVSCLHALYKLIP
ncbi:MAG: hypothetical protein ACD_20C00207G0005 [uncultured bacterium]|nr:MAG: hypothetical protein ACD_20C00207G0005 [uncultured bacterium]HBH19144.1 precorrin-8X methylmutase [Cyanobacteria bacterium UBA9579]